MKQALEDSILALLGSEPGGLSAPELQRRLPRKVSQPTLWRHLDALRSHGLVTVEGQARATRYHAATPTSITDQRSRRLHRIVAEKLARDPSLCSRARARLEKLRRTNPHGRLYHDRWESLLDGPLPPLLRVLTEDSESADALRKESPFTTLVNERERSRVFRAIRAA